MVYENIFFQNGKIAKEAAIFPPEFWKAAIRTFPVFFKKKIKIIAALAAIYIIYIFLNFKRYRCKGNDLPKKKKFLTAIYVINFFLIFKHL